VHISLLLPLLVSPAPEGSGAKPLPEINLAHFSLANKQQIICSFNVFVDDMTFSKKNIDPGFFGNTAGHVQSFKH